MVTVSEFFQFSNPLFLDAFVAVVLYILCRLLASRFPRISAGVREASLVFIVFMCYDASRYFALDSEVLAKTNGRKVIDFEKQVHIDFEIPMQSFAFSNEEFAKFLNHFYLGAHWGGLVIFFVWAYARVIFASPNKMERRRKEYVQARGRFIIMNMIAACSFMAYPCAPPRSFPELGYKDFLLDVGHTDVYTGTRRFVNPYAAMPSMHQGYSLLFAVTIVIMLRSEILASAVEPSEEEDDIESGRKLSTSVNDSGYSPSGFRAFLDRISSRYEEYHVLPRAVRTNSKKLFCISMLPFAFIIYPCFMFVVIVATGNHFVLDALAGASAMALACVLYPFVQRGISWIRDNIVLLGNLILARVSETLFGVRADVVELDVKGSEKYEEKKGFLEETTSPTDSV